MSNLLKSITLSRKSELLFCYCCKRLFSFSVGANGLQQKFHIKFFHYIPKSVENLAKIKGDWIWTSYKVPRPFVLWPIAAGVATKVCNT